MALSSSPVNDEPEIGWSVLLLFRILQRSLEMVKQGERGRKRQGGAGRGRARHGKERLGREKEGDTVGWVSREEVGQDRERYVKARSGELGQTRLGKIIGVARPGQGDMPDKVR
jgi:hypothetical protein